MAEKEIEPATSGWDEHKPPVDWTERRSRRSIVARILLGLSVLPSLNLVAVLFMPSANTLAGEATILVFLGGGLTTLGLAVATLVMALITRRTDRRTFLPGLFGFGLNLLNCFSYAAVLVYFVLFEFRMC